MHSHTQILVIALSQVSLGQTKSGKRFLMTRGDVFLIGKSSDITKTISGCSKVVKCGTCGRDDSVVVVGDSIEFGAFGSFIN